MLKVLPKIHRTLITCLGTTAAFASTKNMRKVGKYIVPDLPAFKMNQQGLRPIGQGQQQMTINDYNDMMGTYKKYRDLPQCRYFAFEHKNRIYHMFNAYHYPMGRMINHIATAIRGKNTPHYKNNEVNVKNGDICVIVNIEDPLLTGKKLLFKEMKYHTGYVGHVKTFSYKAVLNKKPQLLYYYLLRKSMPKTKISEQYLKNIKFFKGPTHNLPNVPQFAPSRFIENPLTQIDFKKYIQEKKNDLEVIFEGNIGQKTGNVLGRTLQSQKQPIDKSLKTENTFSFDRKTKLTNKYTLRQMKAFINLQSRIRRRYKQVRAPYSTKPKHDPGYRMFLSEKEAMKSPYFEELADEDSPEIDEEIVEDPYKRKGFDK